MERRGSNTWLVAVLAVAVGFLAALLIFGGDDNDNTSATVNSTNATTTTQSASTDTTTGSASSTTTTGTQPATTPSTPDATLASCIDLWNQAANRGNQTYLVNLMSQEPIRVHVGATSDTPPKCLITIVTNGGDAYVFPAAGGTTYPYAQAPGKTDAADLPAAQKTSNALEQSDGTLTAR